MEKVGYREELKRVHERFGDDRAFIPVKEVAAWFGCDPRTVRQNKALKLIKNGRSYNITPECLARYLAG